MQDLKNRYFFAGAALRIVLVIFLQPVIQQKWFLPFIESIVSKPSITPWQNFLDMFHDPAAFPYGPVMAVAHLPFVLTGALLEQLLHVPGLAALGFRISLLVADYGVYCVLTRMYPEKRKQIVLFYWLSPIVLYVTYIHGQTDIVPVLLFVLSLLFLKNGKFPQAGAILGLAAAAKFSALAALPFVVLYIFKNRETRTEVLPFLLWTGGVAFVSQASFLFDPGFSAMVLTNPETQRLFFLQVPFGNNVLLYITPLLLSGALYFVWRLKRMNSDLLLATLALGFFVLLFTGQPPPGWFVWLLPFLVIHQLRHGMPAIVLVSALGAAFVAFYAFEATGAFFLTNATLEIPSAILPTIDAHQISLLFTALMAVSVLELLQIMRVGVHENDYYRLTKSPLAIGIAGDSGSGKDTLASALMGLFGAVSTTHLSGDDYHIWDRHSPMWKAVTHLNPRANRLLQFTNDALDLLNLKTVSARHYDHSTGLFSQLRQLKGNDVILISGLHTLFMQALRERMDVAIYLDMNEELRHFLKFRRDAKERGHSLESFRAAMAARESEARRYISPQRQHASLILSLMPLNADLLTIDQMDMPPLKLVAVMRDYGIYEDLVRVLVGVCNLHVNLELLDESGSVRLEIEGDADFSDEDAALAAQILCPSIGELLSRKPLWRDGMLGIMQVIIIAAIDETLRKRR